MTEPFKQSAAWIVQNQPELAAEIVAIMMAKAPRKVISMTKRQQDALNYIRSFVYVNDGIAPTYTQIAAGIGLVHKSGIHRIITGLEERGHIRRLPNRHRAIVVIDRVAA